MSEQDEAMAQDDVLARASWAQLKKLRRNTVKSVRLTLRGDLLDEVELLEEHLRREQEKDEWENREPVAPKIAAQIQELEAEARESETVFKFEGLGQGEFAVLQAAHPATEEVRKKLGLPEDQSLEWNPETFPPALMAASCIEPLELKGNVEEWTEIQQTWSNGQVNRLWGACLSANMMVAETPKSARASEITLRRNSKSS
jgi:hypothetical protein